MRARSIPVPSKSTRIREFIHIVNWLPAGLLLHTGIRHSRRRVVVPGATGRRSLVRIAPWQELRVGRSERQCGCSRPGGGSNLERSGQCRRWRPEAPVVHRSGGTLPSYRASAWRGSGDTSQHRVRRPTAADGTASHPRATPLAHAGHAASPGDPKAPRRDRSGNRTGHRATVASAVRAFLPAAGPGGAARAGCRSVRRFDAAEAIAPVALGRSAGARRGGCDRSVGRACAAAVGYAQDQAAARRLQRADAVSRRDACAAEGSSCRGNARAGASSAAACPRSSCSGRVRAIPREHARLPSRERARGACVASREYTSGARFTPCGNSRATGVGSRGSRTGTACTSANHSPCCRRDARCWAAKPWPGKHRPRAASR